MRASCSTRRSTSSTSSLSSRLPAGTTSCARRSRPLRCTWADSPGELLVGLLGGVAQELGAADGLVVLADPVRRHRQCPQRSEEPAVRLVLPRDRAGAPPAVAPQRVEGAVIA